MALRVCERFGLSPLEVLENDLTPGPQWPDWLLDVAIGYERMRMEEERRDRSP